MSALQSQAHDAVTLGNSNGLTLLGQQLSLNLASSTSTGALSASDWNTFNNKIDFISLSATGGITYDNISGLFGWNGTTSLVPE